MKHEILKHRKIFKLWKNFIEQGISEKNDQLSNCVLKSWKRCFECNLDPFNFTSVFVSLKELEFRRRQSKNLIDITRPYTKTIHQFINGPLGLVLLSDADGNNPAWTAQDGHTWDNIVKFLDKPVKPAELLTVVASFF